MSRRGLGQRQGLFHLFPAGVVPGGGKHCADVAVEQLTVELGLLFVHALPDAPPGAFLGADRGHGEADAAAADGGQHTGQRICRQQEEHAFRRLLHHLQQGVGGLLVHPLHMVEQDGAALGGEAGIENFGAHGLDLTDEIPPARAHAGDGDGLPYHAGLDAAAVAVAGFAHGTAAFAPQKGLSRCAACRVKIVCRHAPGRVARAQARLAHQ